MQTIIPDKTELRLYAMEAIRKAFTKEVVNRASSIGFETLRSHWSVHINEALNNNITDLDLEQELGSI